MLSGKGTQIIIIWLRGCSRGVCVIVYLKVRNKAVFYSLKWQDQWLDKVTAEQVIVHYKSLHSETRPLKKRLNLYLLIEYFFPQLQLNICLTLMWHFFCSQSNLIRVKSKCLVQITKSQTRGPKVSNILMTLSCAPLNGLWPNAACQEIAYSYI